MEIKKLTVTVFELCRDEEQMKEKMAKCMVSV